MRGRAACPIEPSVRETQLATREPIDGRQHDRERVAQSYTLCKPARELCALGRDPAPHLRLGPLVPCECGSGDRRAARADTIALGDALTKSRDHDFDQDAHALALREQLARSIVIASVPRTHGVFAQLLQDPLPREHAADLRRLGAVTPCDLFKLGIEIALCVLRGLCGCYGVGSHGLHLMRTSGSATSALAPGWTPV